MQPLPPGSCIQSPLDVDQVLSLFEDTRAVEMAEGLGSFAPNIENFGSRYHNHCRPLTLGATATSSSREAQPEMLHDISRDSLGGIDMSAADRIILAALAECHQLQQQEQHDQQHEAIHTSTPPASDIYFDTILNRQSNATSTAMATTLNPLPRVSAPVQYQQQHFNAIVTPSRGSPITSRRATGGSAVLSYRALMSDQAAPPSHGHYSLTPRRTQSDNQNRGLSQVPTTPTPPTPSFCHDNLMNYAPLAAALRFPHIASMSLDFSDMQLTTQANNNSTSFSTDSFRSSSRNTDRIFSSSESIPDRGSAFVSGMAVASGPYGTMSQAATGEVSRRTNSRKMQRPGYVCSNCGDTATVRWRISRLSAEHGELRVCNPCGIYERIHGTHRPQDMTKREKRKSRLSPSPTGN